MKLAPGLYTCDNMHTLSDIVQYQVKLNVSELIGAGLELTQVQTE